MAPAFGGKLNSTMASLRSARSDRRRATSLATRAASIAARSPCALMARRESGLASDRPPNVIGMMAPSSSGIATIMVASTGDRPRASPCHCSSVWNSTGCAAIYGTSSCARIFCGCGGVVIGGAADQREAGQRYQRIDLRLAVLQEIAFDRRAGIEAAGESRNDVQSLGFERRDDAVIVRRISRQHIGPHHQDADGAVGAAVTRQFAQLLDDPRLGACGWYSPTSG